jgi:hypothetical protein
VVMISLISKDIIFNMNVFYGGARRFRYSFR